MTKVYERPCLKYFMKLCEAPCTYKVKEENYNRNVEDAKRVLKGNLKIIIQELESKMKNASDEMNFEEAILYRNQILELEKINQTQFMEYGKGIDEDIFSFIIEGKKIFLEILNVRDGKILGKNFNVIELDDKIYESIFEEVVTSYYRKNPVPRYIVFSSEYESKGILLEKWLKNVRGDKVNLFFPKKSKTAKRELLEMAFNNLLKDIEMFYKKKSVIEEGLIKLYNTLELKRFPMRIECFDISNIQGKDAVASMSVAIEGKAEKKAYRKFKILTKNTPDDFQMMREVIERRYGKLEKEEFPDLILIDGGIGQINAVGEVLESLGKNGIADLISIAKREEEVFKYGEDMPYIFSKSDEALKILQRVRDEAHRFGVNYHRALRNKRVISSELDNIPGIGEKRREKLLKKFGSVKKIRESSLEEIKEILPEKVALALLKS
jgi:excinuclease ABC subunit C